MINKKVIHAVFIIRRWKSMALFGKKNKNIQNADFEEVADMNEPADVSGETGAGYAQDTPIAENEFNVKPETVESTVSSYDYGTADAGLPAEEPAVSAAPVADYVQAPSEDIPPADTTPEDLFARIPANKYNLDNIYREIGKEYCNLHSMDPETEFSERVGIVNAIKRQAKEMRDHLISLCRSPWMFFLILLLMGRIALPILRQASLQNIAMQIPDAIVLIGCIIIFFASLARKVPRIGFTLINIVLTFYLIISFIPVFTMLILGIFMKLRGDVDYATLSTSLIVIGVVLALICILFFGSLIRTTGAAKKIAGGGLADIKSSFFVSIIIFLAMVVNAAALISSFLFKDAISNGMQNAVQQLDEYFKQANLSGIVTTLTTVDPAGMKYVLAGIGVDILLLLVVLIILSKIRHKDRELDEQLEEEVA